MKSLAVITTTRADYGIYQPLLRRLLADQKVELRLVVSGTHLSEAYGMTVHEIEDDGMPIDARIPILTSGDSEYDVSLAMAAALAGMAAYLCRRRPDMAMVLGDRSETAAFAQALVNARVPIAHLHGGETTEGAVDECYRHCITKMSYLHFASNKEHARRIIQLGEDPARVFDVGALGVENALHEKLLSLTQLQHQLGKKVLGRPRYAVVTFHPVTLESQSGIDQCRELQRAMDFYPDVGFLCTMANADAGGDAINRCMQTYAEHSEHVQLVASLGMQRYLSALKHAAFVLGNSSSGIIEAPAFGVPTINIGDRQRGRMQASSVLNCATNREAICQAIEKALSDSFVQQARHTLNPYGDGNTSEKIVAVLYRFLFAESIDLKKPFFNIKF